MTALAPGKPVAAPRLELLRQLAVEAQRFGCRERRVRHFRFGPVCVSLSVYGEQLDAALLPAVAHAQVATGGGATIWATDFEGNEPPLVKAFADGLPRDAELVNLRLHPDVAAVWQPGWRSFEAFDRDAGAGMMLVSRLAQAPGWVWAAPMQRLLHWMTVPTTHAIVHGATLTHDGTGLLLAGVSGSGKSTTTARALGGGFGTVGDDLVLVETARRRPVAHALFDAIKVDPSVACELTAAATNWTEVEHKKMCRISDLAPGALMSSFPLDAILIPRVVPGRSTRISAATPTDALRALAPSTMSILRGGEQSTLSKMAKLTRNLPAYHLELGADADQLLDAIRRACREIRR